MYGCVIGWLVIGYASSQNRKHLISLQIFTHTNNILGNEYTRPID